ncbi:MULTISPECIES: hypothetical protein [unclassified Microbacterium]|uniref:hypothetical protein n=1 Tax=unclassified Microbacterium TaxID=2609290 RepID=UPI001604D556|nr:MULTISPECIES: hypothetical protein [unclassified Microbacterium]QNA91804.1 hypothetical protein G4G29_03910 [Microbacterium sp. Se63.02b]QYM65006.1 hypothetical protein K1X59_03900 [Microbacterium sp. Se5.02b]
MTTALRPLVSAVGLIAAALLVAGCTSGPGSETPTSSPAPSAGGVDADDQNDVEGTLLDDGRMFAVITWGSSTCVPQVDQVSAEGQTVTVTLVDPDGETPRPCTKDIAPRASLGALPEGVDPKNDITLNVTYGDITDDVDLDGDPAAAGTPGTPGEYLPSAGWFDDGGLVLLTWGSSSCVPVVESLEGSGNAGTVTFATDEDQVCTLDMAPRATLLAFGDDMIEDDGPFTLTLVGGGLDGTVEVR